MNDEVRYPRFLSTEAIGIMRRVKQKHTHTHTHSLAHAHKLYVTNAALTRETLNQSDILTYSVRQLMLHCYSHSSFPILVCLCAAVKEEPREKVGIW